MMLKIRGTASLDSAHYSDQKSALATSSIAWLLHQFHAAQTAALPCLRHALQRAFPHFVLIAQLNNALHFFYYQRKHHCNR